MKPPMAICEACKGTGRCSDMRCWYLSDICAYCNGTGKRRAR